MSFVDSRGESTTKNTVRQNFCNPYIITEGWYVLARSKEIKPGKIYKKHILRKKFVVFRDDQEKIHATDEHCSHMGASLGDGYLKNNCLVCPFHAFTYNAQGNCISMPSDNHRAKDFNIQSYHLEERWGQVWIYLGAYPPKYSLDVFRVIDSQHHYHFKQNLVHQHRHMMISNIVDASHFECVHGMVINTYEAKFYDQYFKAQIEMTSTDKVPLIFKIMNYKKLHLAVTCYGANNYLVEITEPVKFNILTSYAPFNERSTLTASIASFPKNFWNNHIKLIQMIDAVLKMKTVSDFFADDIKWVNNVVYKPKLISSDKYFSQYIKFCNNQIPLRNP